MTKMTDKRKDLRPREKLQARGAESLSDYELLMAVIGSGRMIQLAITMDQETQNQLASDHQRMFGKEIIFVNSLDELYRLF